MVPIPFAHGDICSHDLVHGSQHYQGHCCIKRYENHAAPQCLGTLLYCVDVRYHDMKHHDISISCLAYDINTTNKAEIWLD